jgi:hypothetical protein
VRRFARTAGVLLVAALATAAGVLLISGDGGSDGGGKPVGESPGPPAPAQTTTTKSRSHHQTTHQSAHHSSTHREVHQAVRESGAPRLDRVQRQVTRVVRAYVGALDARDGARACELFISGALSEVHFPRDRGTCARSLSASIGYRDPRGFPVYRRARIARVPDVAIHGASARVTATTVTRFAGNREPSIEDDLVYLRRQGDGWRIAKPSATLYRAIGVGNIPPQVLAPP